MQHKFLNEIITDKKDRNYEIFWKNFQYQNPSFFAKDLITSNHQAKNEQLVNNIDDGLIDLRNAIIRKEIPENKNPNKIVNIVDICS